MTALPIFPESRRIPAYAAVALVLVMVAVVLAAGCMSQDFNKQTKTLPKEKYVILEHKIVSNTVPISGHCLHLYPNIALPYSFNESTGEIANTVYTYDPEINYNEPLILVYFKGGRTYHNRGDDITRGASIPGWAIGVFSFPRQFTEYSDNVTIDSVSGDGTVALRYNDKSMVLKPKERWENITHRTYTGESLVMMWEKNQSPECSEDIITTDTLYNAGVFDKKIIVTDKTGP